MYLYERYYKGGERIVIKKRFKKMSADEFNQLKAMLEAGVSAGLIRKLTGRAYNTISFIVKSKSFPEYQKVQAEYFGSKRINGLAKPQVKTEDQTVISLLSDIKDLMVAQNATLHRLEELWEYPADYFKRKNLEA